MGLFLAALAEKAALIQTVAMALLLPIALTVCREQQNPVLRERSSRLQYTEVVQRNTHLAGRQGLQEGGLRVWYRGAQGSERWAWAGTGDLMAINNSGMLS